MWLSTAPSEPLTRWCQVRCLLRTPLFAKVGETLSGSVLLVANDRYDQSPFIRQVSPLKQPSWQIPKRPDVYLKKWGHVTMGQGEKQTYMTEVKYTIQNLKKTSTLLWNVVQNALSHREYSTNEFKDCQEYLYSSQSLTLCFPHYRESYDIHITATVDQSRFTSGNILDLKNPFFRLHLIPP